MRFRLTKTHNEGGFCPSRGVFAYVVVAGGERRRFLISIAGDPYTARIWLDCGCPVPLARLSAAT